MTLSDTRSADPRIALALLSVGERSEALLAAYLQGPGRSHWREVEEAAAQVALADYDLPVSRAHLEQYLSTGGRVALVMAMADPQLQGVHWIAKPVSFQSLADSAAVLREMFRASSAAPSTAPAVTPAAQAASTASAGGASTSASFTGAEAARVPPASATALGGPVAGVAPPPARADRDNLPHLRQPGAASSRRAWWVAAAGLLLCGLGVLVWRLSSSSSVADTAAARTTPAGSPAAEVQSAVALALQASVPLSEQETRFVRAQLEELRNQESPDALQARLDRLAADPKALEAYNRNVYNKVHVPSAAGGGTAETSLRRAIESVVVLSTDTAGGAAADRADGFVSALTPEAQRREAEMRTITVGRGDTLGSIAQRAYGDSRLYERIFAANPRVLTSPHHIYPGQVLRVPAN